MNPPTLARSRDQRASEDDDDPKRLFEGHQPAAEPVPMTRRESDAPALLAAVQAELAASEDRLRLLADRTRDVVYRYSVSSGVVEYLSPAATAMTGYAPEEFYADPELWMELVHPDDRAILDGGAQERADAHRPTLLRWIRKDGSVLWTEHRSVAVLDAAGSVIAMEGVARDVTEARQTLGERTLLAAAIEQSHESVLITDTEAAITYVNAAFERISGYTRAEVIGRNPRFLKSGVQSATFFDAMWAALANGLPWVADMTNRRKDGSLYHLTSVISPIRAADGSISGFVAVGRDVTHERELETRTEVLTRERALIADTLSRLPSGGTLESTAELYCRQVGSLSDVAVASLIMFESDGTAVPLAYVARGAGEVGLHRFSAGRSHDFRDRAAEGPWVEAWRGDRDHPYAASLRNGGVQAFAYAPVQHGGSVIGLLAVGSAEPEAMADLSGQLGAIVDFANLAGALFGPRVGDSREARRVRGDIERVIAERAFRPVFQPIVDLLNDRIVGHEALTRFTDGTAPHVRFAEAAAVGLGLELECATIESSLAAAAAIPNRPFLHLNVSPAFVLAQSDLKRLLVGTRARIVLEVTEHAEVGDYAKFLEAIEGVGRPVLLAVDDAGAGFANFRHILELRPAFVKLDVSLVRGIDDDAAKQALVAGMTHFSRMTGRRLIAEGIETVAEADTLRMLDVRLGQGFLLGRPAPLAA